MRLSVFAIAFTLLMSSFSAQTNAQSFGSDTDSGSQSGLQWVSKKKDSNLPNVSDADIEKALKDEHSLIKQQQEEAEFFIPDGGMDTLYYPTIDGSERGGAVAVQMDEKGNSRRAGKIFLYYDNFKISSFAGGAPSCDVRFFILPDLNRKLVSLDVKLVWPGMTTALSFSNVAPNTPTYTNYTLMGNGCYNMDQMPNIVVNRCRVKGMSAVDCANKIVWLSASARK